MIKHRVGWQTIADAQTFIRFCIKPRVIFLFFIIASSSCGGAPETQAEQIWMQMTEEQKREAIINYYRQQQMKQSQQNQSNEQCLEPSSNTLREELMKLQAENSRLQEKLHKEKFEVILVPPAF
jgi:Tfp pilus assembly protein PilP